MAAATALVLPFAARSAAARAAGNFSVSIAAPQTVEISTTSVPDKFPIVLTFNYVGPPLPPPPAEAATTFTVHLSEYTNAWQPSWSNGGANISDCHTEVGPEVAPFRPAWTDFSCTIHFTSTFTSVTLTGLVRPFVGTATTTVTLTTGESASATTEIVPRQQPTPPPPPPTPPPPPPPSLPGPPAAPTQTVTETFTSPAQAEPEAVKISPSAETAQIALTWSDPNASFDVKNITLVPSGGRYLAAAEKLKPGKLKITKKRTKRTLDVRVKNLRRGTLKYKIVAKKLAKPTKVKAVVRQSKR